MNIIRQNTDYALRMLVNLARRKKCQAVSTRTLASEEDVSYQFACKIMQQLTEAGLVESKMGPKGGFMLKKQPDDIPVPDVIEAMQGPVVFNNCLLGLNCCSKQENCPISDKLFELQDKFNELINGVTLADIACREKKTATNTKGKND